MNEGKTRVLVVDDDTCSQNLARIILEGAGFGVISAATATQALAIVDPPSLALVDVRLPDMSGFDLIRELRGRDIAIVCWSAYPGDREAALAVGARCYVEKPIDIEELERAMTELAA